jgi:hypothetical protein
MAAPPAREAARRGNRAADGRLGTGRPSGCSTSSLETQHLVSTLIGEVDFLRRRFAHAIERGDDSHAEICRKLLDRLLNGRSTR